MNKVRMWKDPQYRAESEAHVTSPVGAVELDSTQLEKINGGTFTPAIPIATAAFGCFTVGDGVCNGTGKMFGSKGCC